jgi:hypothetical protein
VKGARRAAHAVGVRGGGVQARVRRRAGVYTPRRWPSLWLWPHRWHTPMRSSAARVRGSTLGCAHANSAPLQGGCSGQRACQHAQLGIPETAHGPTLECHQQRYGSSTHSLTLCTQARSDSAMAAAVRLQLDGQVCVRVPVACVLSRPLAASLRPPLSRASLLHFALSRPPAIAWYLARPPSSLPHAAGRAGVQRCQKSRIVSLGISTGSLNSLGISIGSLQLIRYFNRVLKTH